MGLEEIIALVLTACGSALTALLVWLITLATNWLKEKTSLLSAASEDAVQTKIINLVEIVTRQTMQTYVKNIAEGKKDGKLDDTEKKVAFEKTFNKAVELLREQGITVGKELLSAVIEAVVNKLKGEKNAPENVTTTPS